MTDLSDSGSSGLPAGWTLVNRRGDVEDEESDSTGSSIEVLEPLSGSEDQDPDPEGHPQQAASLSISPECIELQQLATDAEGAAADCTPETGHVKDPDGPTQPVTVSSEAASFAPDLSAFQQFFDLLSVKENASGADKPSWGFSTEEEETSPRTAGPHPHSQPPPHTATSHTEDLATHTLSHSRSGGASLTRSKLDTGEASSTSADEAPDTLLSLHTDRTGQSEASCHHTDEAGLTDRGSQTESSSPEPSSRSRRMSLTSLWSVSSQSSNVSSSSSDDDDDDDGDGADDDDSDDSDSGSASDSDNISDVTSATSSADDHVDQEERRSSWVADSECDCLEAEAASTEQLAAAAAVERSGSQVAPSVSRSSVGSWCRVLSDADATATQPLSRGCAQSSDAQQTAQEKQEGQLKQAPQSGDSEEPQPPDEVDSWNWVVPGDDELTLAVSSSSSSSSLLLSSSSSELLPYPQEQQQPLQCEEVTLPTAGSQVHQTATEEERTVAATEATEEDRAVAATEASAPRPVGRRSHHRLPLAGVRGGLLPTLLMVMVAFFLGHRLGLSVWQSEVAEHSHNHKKCQDQSQHMEQQLQRERVLHEQKMVDMQKSLDKLQKENHHLHKTWATLHRISTGKGKNKDHYHQQHDQEQREASLRHLFFSLRDEREMSMNASDLLHFLARSLNISARWGTNTNTSTNTSSWSSALHYVSSTLGSVSSFALETASSVLGSCVTSLKKGAAETESVVLKHMSSVLSCAYHTVGSSLSHLWNSAIKYANKKGAAETESVVMKHMSSVLSCAYHTVRSFLSHLWNSAIKYAKHAEASMAMKEEEKDSRPLGEEEAKEEDVCAAEEDPETGEESERDLPLSGKYQHLHKDSYDGGRQKFHDHSKQKCGKGKLYSRWSCTMKRFLENMQTKFCQLGNSFKNWFSDSPFSYLAARVGGSFSKLSRWRGRAEHGYFGKQQRQEQKDSRAFHKASPVREAEEEDYDVDNDEMWLENNGWKNSRAFQKGTIHNSDEEDNDGDEGNNENSETFEEEKGRNRRQKKWSGMVSRFLKKTQKAMSRFGDKLHNSWEKVKATSSSLWSEGWILDRMASKVKDKIDRLTARLQKKADRWFRKKGSKHSRNQASDGILHTKDYEAGKDSGSVHAAKDTDMRHEHTSAGNVNNRKNSDNLYEETGQHTPNEGDKTEENEPLTDIPRKNSEILNRPNTDGKGKVILETRGKDGEKKNESDDKANSDKHSDKHVTKHKKEKSNKERKKPDGGHSENLKKKEKKGKNKNQRSKNQHEKDPKEKEIMQSKKFENGNSNKERNKKQQLGKVNDSTQERSEKLNNSKKDRSDPQHKTKKKGKEHSKKEKTEEEKKQQQKDIRGEKKDRSDPQLKTKKKGKEHSKKEKTEEKQKTQKDTRGEKKDRSDPQQKNKKKEKEHSKKEKAEVKMQKQKETRGVKDNNESQKPGKGETKAVREQSQTTGEHSSSSTHSQGRARFQLLSQFQALFSKVNIVGMEAFNGRRGQQRAMLKDVQTMAERYNASLHSLGLPISGSHWLGCQYAFWTTAAPATVRVVSSAAYYRQRVTGDCMRYLASWQHRLLLQEESVEANVPVEEFHQKGDVEKSVI